MVYRETNLVYLKDLWKESIHTEHNSNLGVIRDVEILSDKDEMHQYDDDNKFRLDFIDETGQNMRYTVIEADYDDSTLEVTVEELSNPIVIDVGESFDDPRLENATIEYDRFNIANVFQDNVLDLTAYTANVISAQNISISGITYVDIEVENTPTSMMLYTAGVCIQYRKLQRI